MALEEKFNEELKKALREKNQNLIDVVRQIKSKVKEKIVSGNERIEINDIVYLEEIKTYIKQLRKGIEELRAGGEKAEPLIAKYNFEVEYLSSYLPKLLSEEETTQLVRVKITELGLVNPKDIGRLMGAIMKENKDRVDPALTRQIAEKLLNQ